MSNVKLHYLYRDGSNHKKWAEIVFLGDDSLPVQFVAARLRKSFMVGGLFIAHQVRVPEVFLAAEDHLTFDDHCFHEFESVEATSAAPTDPCGRTIREFMTEVAREAKRGWRAFNPQDRLLGQCR